MSAFSRLLHSLEESSGPVVLLMLSSNTTEDEDWSLIVSAIGLDSVPRAKAIALVAAGLQEFVDPAERRRVSQVSVLKTSDQFVRSITSIHGVDDGEYPVSGISLSGVEIGRGVLFRARPHRGQPEGVRSALRIVADELSSKGYDVTVEPSRRDVPDFLVGYVPDIIARGPVENLVIEVKGSALWAQASKRVHHVSRMVNEHPGWRFLVLSVDDLGALFQVSDFSARRSDIIGRVEEAKRLSQSGHSEAAFLLAWIAVESAMRMNLQQKTQWGGPPSMSASDLIMRLALDGTLGSRETDRLRKLFHRRNALVHGFASQEAISAEETREDVLWLARTAVDLLSEPDEAMVP